MATRDNRPVMAINCGGRRGTYAAAPWFGLRWNDYHEARNWLVRQYVTRPGTRYLTCCPYGDYNPLHPQHWQPFAPHLAVDVQPWVRAAHADALAEAKRLRTGLKVGVHLGLIGDDADHFAAVNTLELADKPWITASIQQYDRMGINGEFSLDTSSMTENAALSEAIAGWIAPNAEIMLEGIPFLNGNIALGVDAARLVKYPAWARENNQWVQQLATNGITAPLSYGGKPCREAVIVWMTGDPLDPALKDWMRLARQRKFSIGCDDRYDGVLQEVMQEFPAA